MERLQQAIQRARKERQGRVGNVPDIQSRKNLAAPNVQPISKSSAKSAAAAVSAQYKFPGPPPNPIKYTKSRVVSLDDAHMEANRVIAGRGGDERVEAYRQLRTQVMETLNRNNWTTLAITSPMKNAGKTLTSVNLSISLAQEVNHSVLLVDLDLSEPDVHGVLGVEVEYGLIDVLEKRATVEQAMFNPCLLYTSPSPRDLSTSRMPSSA